MRRFALALAVAAPLAVTCAAGSAQPASDSAATGAAPAPAAFDAAPWARLLSTYATADGGVRYAALRANAEDRAALDAFAVAIGRFDPSALPRDAQLAFYLDAYNALVVKAVVDRWPVASVERVPGFFDRVRHRVAGRAMTLNGLENDVIRARFAEPRIHFALNCASASCPPLSRTPYAGSNLRARLEAATRAFVRRTVRLDRAARTVHVSRIFEWYEPDFGGVRAFVAARLPEADAAFVRDASTRLAHDPYDWSLNAR